MKKVFRWILLVAFVCALGWGGYATYSSMSSSNQSDEQNLDRYYTVTSGGFNVTILLDGTLDAIKHYDVRVDVRRYERIIKWAVEDKTHVKKDDPIVILDSDKFDTEADRLRLEIENLNKELELAIEDIRITEAENLSSVKEAADKLKESRKGYERYRNLDAPKSREDYLADIADAENALDEAEDALEVARQNRFSTESQDADTLAELDDKITAAETTVATKESNLKSKKYEYRIFRQYDHPKKMRELKDALSKAKLESRKSLVSAEAKDIKQERNIINLNKRLKAQIRDLEQVEKDIENLTMRAPVDGIVTLGNRHRRHWQEPKEIKVGTTLSNNENVAYIPDLSRFEVKLTLAEEFRSQVKVGLPVTFRNPSIENLDMTGTVQEISIMPHRLVDWDSSSPNVYDIVISTEVQDPRMMPGMSVDVEMIVDQVNDVLFVPVEAVYNREGQTYCKIKSTLGNEEKKITVGRHSLSYVEITEGLNEGDEVLLMRLKDVVP